MFSFSCGVGDDFVCVMYLYLGSLDGQLTVDSCALFRNNSTQLFFIQREQLSSVQNPQTLYSPAHTSTTAVH